MNLKKSALWILVGVLGGWGQLALAAPTVSQDGLDVTITTSTAGQVVTITYLVEVGGSPAADSWIGTTMDALSIQFGCAGMNCNSIIDSISPTATTSANVNGTWTGFLGKVSGTGCDSDNSESVCYTRLPTGVGGAVPETIMAANTAYTFTFDVTFKDGVDVAAVLSGEHSIKFLSVKGQEQCSGPPTDRTCVIKWSTGNQLSQSGSFDDGTDDGQDLPEPGSLALLGAGLIGIGLISKRRRRTA